MSIQPTILRPISFICTILTIGIITNFILTIWYALAVVNQYPYSISEHASDILSNISFSQWILTWTAVASFAYLLSNTATSLSHLIPGHAPPSHPPR